MIIWTVKSLIKFRKKKLWAEMLVNMGMQDIPKLHIQLCLELDVNWNVTGVTLREETFVTGGVHACNWLLTVVDFINKLSVQIYYENLYTNTGNFPLAVLI